MVAKEGWSQGKPFCCYYRDALQFLVTKGVLPSDDFETYSAMVGFRNRVVHGYQQVSDQRVYEISVKETGSFKSFIDQVSRYLQTN
ncbi:MAG: DUF86 domain-containing protein [Firmicutes bacterium]|nr:DUF86 domain-containing protein [Bacillota bacterium]